MKYKLFGLLQLLATKQRYFIRGARQRLILTANMLNVKSGGKPIANVEHTRITMKPNLPVNLSEVIKNIADSQDFIPLAVSLGWLPDGYDPEEIMEQLAEQRAKEQPQSVVSDVNADVAPEEVGDADGEETA